MAIIEKLWTISRYELMLLARNRSAIVCVCLISLAGGVLFALAARFGFHIPSTYGLLFVLPFSSLILARESVIRYRIGRVMRLGLPSPMLSHVIGAVIIIPFLLAQIILYVIPSLILHSDRPDTMGLIGVALLISLLVGFAARAVRQYA